MCVRVECNSRKYTLGRPARTGAVAVVRLCRFTGVARLAGHMKQSSAGASFTSRHHITSRGRSVSSRLSALVMSCRLQVINPVCLSPPVVASTPPAPFALVSDFSGAWLAPVLPPLGRLSHGQSWLQTFFLTLHLLFCWWKKPKER